MRDKKSPEEVQLNFLRKKTGRSKSDCLSALKRNDYDLIKALIFLKSNYPKF